MGLAIRCLLGCDTFLACNTGKGYTKTRLLLDVSITILVSGLYDYEMTSDFIEMFSLIFLTHLVSNG